MVVSLVLVPLDGIGVHAAGYVTGALIPILVVGFVRRADLARRRSAAYEPSPILPPALVVLAVAAVVVAGLHVWPIATELSS